MRVLHTRAYVLVSFSDAAASRPARLLGNCAIRRGVRALARRLAARIPQSGRKIARPAVPPQNLTVWTSIDD